jgi:hypothetical protein
VRIYLLQIFALLDLECMPTDRVAKALDEKGLAL